MADASWTRGSGRDDGWGPPTSVRSTSSGPPAAEPRIDPRADHAPSRSGRPGRGRTPAAERVRELGKATRRPPGSAQPVADDWQSGPPQRSASPVAPHADDAVREHARGLPAWIALLLLVAIMVAGLVIDGLRGESLGTGFDLGIIVGSVVAILAVRRAGMFWVVVAPPIVYSLGAGVSLYTRSSGLSDRSVLIDAAANWLIYGFPAIAAASAAVLIIAGIRLIARR